MTPTRLSRTFLVQSSSALQRNDAVRYSSHDNSTLFEPRRTICLNLFRLSSSQLHYHSGYTIEHVRTVSDKRERKRQAYSRTNRQPVRTRERENEHFASKRNRENESASMEDVRRISDWHEREKDDRGRPGQKQSFCTRRAICSMTGLGEMRNELSCTD